LLSAALQPDGVKVLFVDSDQSHCFKGISMGFYSINIQISKLLKVKKVSQIHPNF